MRSLLISLLLGLLLGLPFATGRLAFSRFGAYPHNDDFLYARCAQIMAEEHRYQHVSMIGSLTATVAAHSAWGALICSPLGFSYENLHLSVAIIGWIGAVCIFAVGRQLGASQVVSFITALTLVVGPYYYGMSFTFMTDVTAAALVAISSAAYFMGLKKQSNIWLLSGALGATAALWTRQTHLVVIVFPLLVLTLQAKETNNWKKTSLAMILSCLLPILGYCVYELGWLLPGNDNRLPRVSVRQYNLAYMRHCLLYVYQASILTGFVTLPLMPLMLAAIRHTTPDLQTRVRRWIGALAIMVSLIFLAIFLAKGGRLYITQATGYILHNGHYGPILLADQHDPGRWADMGDVEWPVIFWQILTLGAIANLGLLAWWTALTVWEWRTDLVDAGSRLVSCSAIGLIAIIPTAMLGLLLVIETLYDRYWMLFYPAIFLFLLTRFASRIKSLPAWTWGTSAILLSGMFAMSFVFTHDFLAWNQARGKQVEKWLGAGLTPAEFDAGSGINGWYRSLEDPDTWPRPGDKTLYWRGLADVALSIGPREGWNKIDQLTWHSWAVGRQCKMYVIQRNTPNAPTGP